jgi:hypothetical protein
MHSRISWQKARLEQASPHRAQSLFETASLTTASNAGKFMDLKTILANGTVLREPVGAGNGYWAGCPGLWHDTLDGVDYLTYRIRRPRGVQPERGGEVRIARSADGRHFEDVWRMTKDQVNSASIERTHLVRGKDGGFRYFASYVAPEDGRWCVTITRSDSVAALTVANMQRLFTATDFKLEGIKDPWVFQAGGDYFMLLSIALPTAQTSGASHSTLDIYNTGECVSATGLAVSKDLVHWEYLGTVFQPEATGWDCYCRRINSILPHNGRYYGFYDGSASHVENYEEKCGLAVSDNLKTWKCLTPDGPLVTSPFASGSLRYVDACPAGPATGKARWFYEFAREDGAHDLRVAEVEPSLWLPR